MSVSPKREMNPCWSSFEAYRDLSEISLVSSKPKLGYRVLRTPYKVLGIGMQGPAESQECG